MYNIKDKTTYSGDPASFVGKAGDTIGSITASITPTQDLHGYDNPWPGGGGKNLVGLNTSPARYITYAGVSATDHTDDAVTLTSNGKITYAHMGLYYDLPAGTYTFSIKTTSSDSYTPVVSGYRLSDNALLFNSCKEGTPKSFTLSEIATVNFRFFSTTSDSTARTVTFYDVQLESGTTATAWTPYSNICPITGFTGANIYVSPTQNQADATVYNVNWTSEAGTVYGGTVDVVSGKLVVDKICVNLNTSWYWFVGTTQPNGLTVCSTNGFPAHTIGGEICSHYKRTAQQYVVNMSLGEFITNGTSAYFCFKGESGGTAQEFKDYITAQEAAGKPIQVVYELATPVEYTLTPQEVTALLGQNYVWSDLDSTVSVSVLSDSAFHTLAIADSPKTRCRIYFIGDGVDCTDDEDVQTNGTLLVGAVGDADSNGRIGQDGITFTEMFNPDKNIQIGTAVSYQIGMTLLNTDGALNGFSYGRCKVYLDVYDAANSAWRVCPMGVFVIDIPTKRKVQLVSATGYDQMQLLDTICDSWWSGLNWSGGITLSALLTSMANQLGVKVSTATASALLNSSVSYTEAPFACVEVTYREALEYIAEATGTIARFDRDGYLDLRFFSAAQIGGNTVTINADTVGNTCLDIDIAEYQAAAIDLLKVKIAEDDIGVTVGSGTNQYTIVNNLFLYGSTATIITNRATPIYNRLNGLGAYTPIQAKLIYDWSLEAGDIINIVRDSTTYPVLIFQQTLTWRGGYVTADILADGDNVRPVMDYDERASYRMASEMSQKVGDNEIISKINQTAESIQIQASRVDLAGYVTFTNLSTSGQTTINGGNITTGTIDASVVTVDNINASNISSGTLSAARIAAGSLAIGKLDTSAQNTINGANKQEQLIYRSKAAGTTSLSKTTTWITNTTGNQDTWTLKRPTYNSSYPVLFVATQRKDVGGTVTCTTPQIDNTTTVIDGGHITTGTIDASVVSVTNLNASNITSGTMSASKISGGTLTLGGSNNTNGTMTVKDANGNTAATVNNNGITINGSTSKTVLDGGLVKIQNASAAEQNVSLEYVPISGTSPAGYVQKMYTPSSGTRTVSEGFWWYIGNKAVAEIYSAGDSVANCDEFVGLGVGWTPISGSAKFVVDKLRSSDIEAKDLSVYGVLDVTNRRTNVVSLSTLGWYRAIMIATAWRGGRSFAVDICIGRTYANTKNEIHRITLLANWDSFAFVDEISKSDTNIISGIRYTHDSNNGYIDIQYLSLSSNNVYVDFDVHCYPTEMANFTAQSLQSVADSPSGETVLAEYTFAANTLGPSIGQYSEAITSFSNASGLGNYYHAFLSTESTINIKPRNVLAVFTDWGAGSNSVTGFTVHGTEHLYVSFVNDTPCTVYITYIK